MKDHATAGITLSMKNCFGITPVHHLRRRAREWTNRALCRTAGAAMSCTLATGSPRKRAAGERSEDTPREDA